MLMEIRAVVKEGIGEQDMVVEFYGLTIVCFPQRFMY
jgi:hypothetical protein